MANKKIIIENYIEIDGEDVLLESLSEERRAQIATRLQDTVMRYIGLERVSAPK